MTVRKDTANKKICKLVHFLCITQREENEVHIFSYRSLPVCFVTAGIVNILFLTFVFVSAMYSDEKYGSEYTER